MVTERFLTSDEIDSYAAQAARFQDLIEKMGFPIEGQVSEPQFLFRALGKDNARLVTERMVEIRRDPEERAVAEEAERRVLTPPQSR